MSTYTDLKNRVKETITVGFRPEDRVTTQKVRFYNEENEYWGSFSGSLKGNVNVYNGKLSSVDIYNATLMDPVIKTSSGMIIELGTMADQLEELSVYAHEDLSNAISSCVKDIRDICDAISAVPVDTADQLSALSGMIGEVSSALDFEISARISSDQQLSSEFAQRIRDLASHVAEEDSRLRLLISNLSGAIDDEVSSRISADGYLSASLTKYADDRRHYELAAMDAAPQMPIKATEFAVNRLVDYDLPDGFVVNQDKNQLIGWVEAYGPETGNCRFTAYSDARYPSADYAQMLGVNPYTFDSNVSVRQCPDAVHQLVYSKTADGQLSDNHFDIRVLMSNIRMLRHDGRTIGYVYNAGTESSVSSGTLQFIPSQLADDPILSSFADGREVTFSINVNGGKISGVYTDCELQLISAYPAFSYRAHLSSWPRALLSGGFENYGARVYRGLIEEDDNGQLKSFAVTMVPAHSMPSNERQNFFLSSSEGFRSVVHEYDDRSFDVLEYDSDAKTVRYFNEKKYLSSLVWVQEHGRRFDIPLCALQANTGLSSAEEAEISFAILSNAVADALKPLLSATYQLRRVGDVLVCSMATADESSDHRESVVIQIQNSGQVYAEFQAPNEAKSVFDDANSGADFSQQGVYQDDSPTPYASYGFDIATADFSGVDQLDGGHGLFQIGAAASEGDEYTDLKIIDEYAKFGRPSYDKDEIVIEIPDKDENSSESREFLFVLRPRGVVGRKATIRFVTPAGDPIQFFAEHKNTFQIDCGKFITFRLQEIVSGKFALLDWDQSVQESRLDDIDRRLAEEISNREQAVLDLSGEVFEQLDAHELSILANREDIDFILPKSMIYCGTLLSADTGADKDLSCYFRNALGHAAGYDPVGPDFMFKTGFTYRLSAEQTDLFGPDGVRVSLYPKDIITFNRDARLSSVCAGDFDVINDYNSEIYGVSSALCSEIRNLSTALSGEIQNLSTALSGEIRGLSSELTGLISSTSAEITGIISAVSSDLCAAVDAKFALCADVSELAGEFRRLSSFVDRTLHDPAADRPGILKLRDEFDYAGEPDRNYEMRMISGTIMLSKIS